MKLFKTAMALFLAVCLCFGTVACKKDASSGSSNNESGISGGGYTSNTEDGYKDTVSDWEDEQNNQSGDFDNTANTNKPTPTPGQTTNDSVTNLNKPVTDTTKPAERVFAESELKNPDSLQYYYEGSCYVYGIDKNGRECIAYKDKTGKLLDVLVGAGRYNLMTSRGVLVSGTGTVKSFKPTMKDGYDALIVDYNATGRASGASNIQYVYFFKENCISVQAQISVNSQYTISAKSSSFTRDFRVEYIDEEYRLNSKWIYPENGDYPYQDFESLCFKTQITDEIYLYSFQRGNIRTEYGDTEWGSKKMPLSMEDGTGVLYTHEYDLTFVDTLYENNESADYRGLFKGLNSDFAAGISPIKETEDNSTLFIGNSVDLNLNVTNLTNDDIKFSLRYDVRDYYGNIVDKGIFIDSTVYQYTSANRTINISGKYGMYYLNLYVVSKYSSYIECYPFAFIEDYTYKYNATSPWGMTSPNTKSEKEGINAARLFAKIGVSNFRITSIYKTTYEECIKLGINRFNSLTDTNFKADTIPSYMNDISKKLKEEGHISDSVENGNEANLDTINGSVPVLDRYVEFYNYMFLPVYTYMKENYPHLKYIPSPFSAGQQEWIDYLTKGVKVDNDGDGIEETTLAEPIWDKIDVVSTHIYATPWMPDSYGAYKPAYKAGLWYIEPALQRLEECITKYCNGDKNGKDLYITEVGYSTPSGYPTYVDLRTQADYCVRSGVLCAAYGADRIQFYCTFDKKTWGAGYDPDDREWNFGAYYAHDFYGRIMPKPWGVAFANMTRILESIEKDSMYIYDKYDEGYTNGGVRAFKCNTALKGDVIIAYSNNEVLNNGRANAAGLAENRTPNLPWNNQWKKVDETVFDAIGDTVTVIDIMGNKTEYKAKAGKVTIPLTGSPVYILGAN